MFSMDRQDTIYLRSDEIRICKWVGKQRFAYACRKNLDAGEGNSKGNKDALNHIRGAKCELAASILLNVSWRANIGETKEPDIGRNIEVKSTDRDDGRLIVKPDEHASDDAPYVLVYFNKVKIDGEDRIFYSLVGWMLAGDARKFPIQSYGKDPCHYVDRKCLHGILTLPIDR